MGQHLLVGHSTGDTTKLVRFKYDEGTQDLVPYGSAMDNSGTRIIKVGDKFYAPFYPYADNSNSGNFFAELVYDNGELTVKQKSLYTNTSIDPNLRYSGMYDVKDTDDGIKVCAFLASGKELEGIYINGNISSVTEDTGYIVMADELVVNGSCDMILLNPPVKEINNTSTEELTQNNQE